MPYAALACGLLMFLLSIAKAYPLLFALGPALVWLLLADRSVGLWRAGGAQYPGVRRDSPGASGLSDA